MRAELWEQEQGIYKREN